MKNIGILTWHKTVNHGAVLQAYALQEVIKSKGMNVIELDYNRDTKKYNYTKIDRIKTIFKNLNINKVKIKLNQKQFLKVKKDKFDAFKKIYMNVGKIYNDGNNDIDIAVIGSDMVFDFFEGYNPFMYGKDVNAKRIISYAACFGYTTVDSFEAYENKEEIISLLKDMNAISYRDDNTGIILKECCGINGMKVIDPVLLYGFSKEKIMWNKHGWDKQKYILIYSYSYNMNKTKEIRDIKKFAKENNLKIISVGYDHPWCDEVVNADPCEFVELFNNATYVVTDTFHGTIFSLTLNKQFCVIIRNNAFKILDILKDLDIDPMLNNNIYDKLIYIKNKNLDYKKINFKIEELRLKSTKYLEDNIR